MHRIFGINSVSARLALGAAGIRRIWIREGRLSGRLEALLREADSLSIAIERVTVEALDKMTSVTHQGVALEAETLASRDEKWLIRQVTDQGDDVLLLVLDGVTDPRNLGACLRSAASMGVMAVVLPKDNSAPVNEAAIKTAAGGASIVPLVSVTNLARCLAGLKKAGIWIVGTLLEAEARLDETPLTGSVAIVMGSEGRGLRQNTIKQCDFLARIPMVNEALGFNVSVATGICLYEADRQRRMA